MSKDRMRKLYLPLFSLIGLISFLAAYPDDVRAGYPHPASGTLEELGWFIFGTIVLLGIVIVPGIFYCRQETKKADGN